MIPSQSERALLWRLNDAGDNKSVLRSKSLYEESLIFAWFYSDFGDCRLSFIKVPSTKFHGNPSGGSRTDTRRQTDGWT